ncbi:MAG: NAD(P)/FAD-dependent oxidoreductase [Dehalococcoidia bacterium]|nr:NAD(P)/FAD-dependent oxidoreductase [Dehalococcoidia bacterium]
MGEFDVIVIGAGPAGCYAALTAAKNGCRVAIFEEHLAVGWPRHDPGWLMDCDFSDSVIAALGRAVPATRAQEYRVLKAESGDLIEKSPLAGYMVRRDILDKELAVAAVQAGAKLYLKTKVTGLVRKAGQVEGVETNSSAIPRAEGRVFICADGIRSANGFAAEEGLCARSEPRAGLSLLLANAEVTEGIVEHFLSPDPVLNYKCLWGHRNGMCYFGLTASMTLDEFTERQDNVVSRKLRNALAVEVTGFGRALSGKYAEHFKRMVKDNIMFVGDASGGSGNIHAMIQGQFAGKVAASAIKGKEVSEARLGEYQDSVLKTLGKAPFYWYSAREDFGTFHNWFREFKEATRGIAATELGDLR